MIVLAVVQQWDSKDPIRGFTVKWIEEMASNVEKVIVIALDKREEPRLENIEVHSLGKENNKNNSFSKLRYLYRWHKLFTKHIKKCDVVFTHMTPVYSVLSFPYCFFKRIPIVTWYAHKQIHLFVKLSHLFSSKICTINEYSFPYSKKKVSYLGHGIAKIEKFPLPENRTNIVSVGRLSPIKNLETLIESVSILKKQNIELNCKIVGSASKDYQSYENELRKQVDELGLQKNIDFVGSVPNEKIPGFLNDSFAHVNLAPTGALDKAAIEAMLAGRASLVANEAFSNTFEKHSKRFIYEFKNSNDLADKIKSLISLDQETLNNSLDDVFIKAKNMYSLEAFMKTLVNEFRSVVKNVHN